MKGTTINIGFAKGTAAFFKKNASTILFATICVIGYVLGISSIGKDNNIADISVAVAENFIRDRVNEGYLFIFFNSLLVTSLFLFVSFLSGVSLAGIPFLGVICFLRGFFYGTASGYVIDLYSFKGVAFVACVLAIPALVSATAVILSCREAFSFSLFLLKSFSINGNSFSTDFKIYSIRFLLICCLVVLSSALDSLFSILFAGLFGIV